MRSLFVVLPLTIVLMSCSSRPRSKDSTSPTPAPAPTASRVSIFASPAFAQVKRGPKAVSLSDIAERAVRSVVNISSTRVVHGGPSPYHGNPFFERFHGPPPEHRAKSLGSGVIVAPDLVLTNNHVVEHADEIQVLLASGQPFKATIIGTDPKSDLALLRLPGDTNQIEPLPFGDSSKLRLGEVVLAIGNPFGVGQTVTMGIVSALGRANMGIVDYEDFIQTDAAINPGNSGGALVNMRGELVGINTAILSRSGGYQGIGFSIPSMMAHPIMDSLLKHGKVIRGWLGVEIQSLTPEIARVLNLPPDTQGVLVAGVQPDSPAAKAGVNRGDVIVELDGKPMRSVARLRNLVGSAGSSATIKLKLLQGGKPRDLSIALGVLPGDQVARLDPSQGVLGGLTVEPLTDETRKKLGLDGRVSGAVVTQVKRGSAADAAGLRPSDVILEINRRPVKDAYQFSTVYKQARDRVLLLIYREGTTLYLLLEK